jgi:hypothetical protein
MLALPLCSVSERTPCEHYPERESVSFQHYEDQPTIARAIREGLLDKKHERALKALSFVMDNARRAT